MGRQLVDPGFRRELTDDYLRLQSFLGMPAKRPIGRFTGGGSTGSEAIAPAAELHPDVVVMGSSMKDINDLEFIRQIRKTTPAPEILVLCRRESEQIEFDVLGAGTRGYITKTNVGGDLIVAVDALRQHKVYFDCEVSETLLRAFLAYRTGTRHQTQYTGPLTPREREIQQLVTEGKSNEQVAMAMNISVKTVETHWAHVMAKLGLHSVGELARYVVRKNMISC